MNRDKQIIAKLKEINALYKRSTEDVKGWDWGNEDWSAIERLESELTQLEPMPDEKHVHEFYDNACSICGIKIEYTNDY